MKMTSAKNAMRLRSLRITTFKISAFKISWFFVVGGVLNAEILKVVIRKKNENDIRKKSAY
jgi:hypothetical protein